MMESSKINQCKLKDSVSSIDWNTSKSENRGLTSQPLSNQLTVPVTKPLTGQPIKNFKINGNLLESGNLTQGSSSAFLGFTSTYSDVQQNLQTLNEVDRETLEAKAVLFSGFSSEFAKFLKNNSTSEPLTKKCSVKLLNIDANKSSEVGAGMETAKINTDDVVCRKVHTAEETKSKGGSSDITSKRENEQTQIDGPTIKKPKSDDVIVLDSGNSNSTSPDVSLIKSIKPSSSPKENLKSDVSRISESKPKLEKHGLSSYTKPFSSESPRKLDGSGLASKPNNSKADNSDRTSLRDLEARLMNLQQKAAQESKPKSKTMSPGVVKPSSKDNHHRRPDHSSSSSSLERKKSISGSSMSPVKTANKHKKHLSSPSTSRESKSSSIYSPTSCDAKVTILPCKTVPKEGDNKIPSMGSNSVTITKVSSGENVSSKDIKKVFSPKSESRLKNSDLDPNSLFKPDKVKVKGSEKSDKVQKDFVKIKDKEHKTKDKDRERGGRVGSLKIIRCSKCREVFSTKEAKKLHTCNSILDAHFLIDGGDRQKTSPISTSSTSDRSESTSASLSRSSSRSSSPGIPFPSSGKKSESPKLSSKVIKKLDEERFAKVKISINKLKPEIDDDEKLKEKRLPSFKKDPMREKWIESKRSDSTITSHTSSLESKNRSDTIVIEQMSGHASELECKERRHKEEGNHSDIFAFSGKRTYSPSMTEAQLIDGKVSPRETNNKDSPASQADSGIFSIASSASPSKIDGGINTDVRSPDSPRSNDKTEQWKSSSGSVMTTSADIKTNCINNKSGNGFPSGISLPVNTSITRVASTPGFCVNTTSLHKGQVSTSSPGWVTSHSLSHPYYLDDKDRKLKTNRGRPRKNGDLIFGGKGKGSKTKASSDEDKDMYDFEMEEEDGKPVQPLRPRRQNAQPVTYKDPDSDEDAKSRPPQIPLIQATQGYKNIHEKSQAFAGNLNYNEMSLNDGTIDQISTDGGDEKDRNVLYKCSTIEETPTGGIKLKIKINKKSASPVPSDNEPPMKKSKVEESEIVKTEPSNLMNKPPLHPHSILSKTDVKLESSVSQNLIPVSTLNSSISSSASIPVIREVTSLSQGGLPSPTGIKPKNSIVPSPQLTTTSTVMANNMNSGSISTSDSNVVALKNISMMSSRNMTTSNSMMSTSKPVTSFSAVHNKSHSLPSHSPMVGSNNNPPPVSAPISNGDETKRTGLIQTPYSQPFPQQSQPQPNSVNSSMPNQNNIEMARNFSSNNYMEMNNYSTSSFTNYSQQHSMYSSSQYQHHIASFRPGMRASTMMNARPPHQPGPAYLPSRMMEPRFQGGMGDSDSMHHAAGVNPHQNHMVMQGMMPSHINMGMRHPSMIGALHHGMNNPNMPLNPYPGSPHSGMGQKGIGMGVPNGGQILNSAVMNPMSNASSINPRAMSPHTERPLIGPPSMSPSSIGGNERAAMFASGQYRLNSPQYSPHHQPQSNFGQSPNYNQTSAAVSMYKAATPQPHTKPSTPQQPQSQQPYTKPPTPQQSYPQPTTPQSYNQPTTPQHSYQNPPTPQSNYTQPLTPQNPSTPGSSYPNPSTPGTYHNPTTPLSQNPLTPQSFEAHTPGGSASQHNNSFDSPTNQPVIQTNPIVSTSNFAVPNKEPSNNIYSKVTTPPMLSPPSTTSSLRNVRIPPKKSVTPGTVSPGQKNLSPSSEPLHVPPIKNEPVEMIVPKSEPVPSLQSPKTEPIPNAPIKQEPVVVPFEVKTEPSIKEEELQNPSSPIAVKTPEPPKEPRWGEEGPEGMPERALEIIFSYVCFTDGCIPFLLSAMRVCKLWNKVAIRPKLWTHANLGTAVKEKSRTEKKLEWILKNKFANAIQVDLTSWKAVMSTPALRIIAANCSKISGLGLSNCVKLNYEDVRIVPSLFPLLSRIDLSLVSPATASSRSAVSSSALSDLITTLGDRLTHFNMSSNKMAGLPFVFKALAAHSKNLKFLDVSNISTTSRDTILINIEKLQKGCPLLRVFRSSNTMLGLNDVPVREQVMSPGFPMLEELTIGVDQRGYFDGMDDQQIERVLKKSNNLRLLDIRGCKGISDSTLVRLPCWDIEYLYVAGCSVTSSSKDGLELLVRKWCKTLIELDIGLTSDQKTVDWAVMAFVESEEKLRLRKLNLTGTAVSLKPLTKLLNCCDTLASLNLTSCRALPRGMKRMYHSRDDVQGLIKDITDGKFDARDHGSDDDD